MEITVKIEAPGLEGALHTLAQVLANYEMPVKDREVETKKEAETPAPKTETKKADPEPEQTEKEEKQEPTITLEAVRAKLTQLAQAGKQKEVKELISGLGAAKLTDVSADQYAELLEKAEGLL
jgi:outer membrane biosynthesis protein TonB